MSIKPLYEMTGVSQSGYYVWFRAAPSGNLRKLQNQDGFELTFAAYKMHGYSKATKGIYMALLHIAPPVVMNLKKIRRLTHKFNLSSPYRGSIVSHRKSPYAQPNTFFAFQLKLFRLKQNLNSFSLFQHLPFYRIKSFPLHQN